MSASTLGPVLFQVTPVRLVTEPASMSEPWPVGYTMTVWGVAIGVTVLFALTVSAWLRMSPHARALAVQTLFWRLSPFQLLVLRAAARASGTPAATLLISRGAFESAVSAWAGREHGATLTPKSRQCLETLSGRLFGHPPA
ncbi:MAG: hypothetical protein Q8L55_13655 [Phycisphaerales bacterium]|nr:hypothetical protein [Phycisphaerales bacterium]